MSIPLSLALTVLVSGLVFCALWWLDHKTHEAIWRSDIQDGELRTHRMILIASWGLLGSLVLMGVHRFIALPLFIGCFVARTTHEAIDEFRWHVRCSERETLIHLGMWISVHAGTSALFVWAFFFGYQDLGALPLPILCGFGVVFLVMTLIGRREMSGYRGPRAARTTATAAGA